MFDIQQGVAIGLFVKTADGGNSPARVFHANLWGEREAGLDGGKYGWLASNDVESTAWNELAPKTPRYLFIPRDEALAEEYETGWAIPDVFPVNSVGIVTARDKLAVRWSRDEMKQVATEFSELSEEKARARFTLGRDSQDWKVSGAQADLQSNPEAEKHLAPILYRPFDARWTYYTGQSGGFICRPREAVMRHMLAGTNLGLIASRQVSVDDSYSHALVSRFLVDNRCTYSSRGIMYMSPLYAYSPDDQGQFGSERQPNLSDGFVQALGSKLGLGFTANGPGDLRQSFGPEDALHYIYAVLHSPEYRRRYADFLKSDFPRVPLTSDRELFAALVGLGERLAALHLMESEGDERPAFPEPGGNHVDKVRYVPPFDDAPGRVYINLGQYFDGVSPETWEFTIGGYRPAEKWLKDRRKRTLTYDDIAHYQQMCAALAETPRLMSRIDEVIAAHGGWPLG